MNLLKRLRFSSIRQRLVLLVCLVIVATVTLSLGSTFWVLGHSEKKQGEQSLEQAQRSLQGFLQAEVEGLQVKAKLLTELPILKATVATRDVPTIRDTAGGFREELNLQIFDLFDPSGQFLASVGAPSKPNERQSLSKILRGSWSRPQEIYWTLRGEGLALLVLTPFGEGERMGYLALGRFLDEKFAERLKVATQADFILEAQGARRIISGAFDPDALVSESFTRLIDSGELSRMARKARGDAGILPKLTLLSSRSEAKATRLELGRVVVWQSGGTLFLGVVAALIIAGTVTRPIRRLEQVAKEMIQVKDLTLRAPVDSKDEIGRLGESFNHLMVEVSAQTMMLEEYNRNLESWVKERTQQLKDANDEIERLVENLDQGFMVFDPCGKIRKGATKKAFEFFGTDPTDKDVTSVLGLDEAAGASFKGLASMAVGGVMAFEDVVPVWPQKWRTHDGRNLGIEYRPIRGAESDQILQFICITSDKTREWELKAQADLERAHAQLVVRCMSNRAAFSELISESSESFTILNEFVADRKSLKPEELLWIEAQIHTLKGNLASFSVAAVANRLHELEEQIQYCKDTGAKPEQTRDLIALGVTDSAHELLLFLSEFGQVLGLGQGSGETSKWVPVSWLEKIRSWLDPKSARIPSEAYEEFVSAWFFESPEALFSRFESAVKEGAERIAKDARIEILPSKLRLNPEPYRKWLSSMVHVFRNAVAHGIEAPEEREILGKPRQGVVRVEFGLNDLDQSRLQVRVIDDGKGISVDQVKSIAVSRGLISQERADALAPEQAVELILLPGFSAADSVSQLAGRGVGLSAVLQEVQEMEGSLLVKSNEGIGTEFVFDLPFHGRRPS